MIQELLYMQDIYPKELKALSWREISSPMFIAVLFTLANRWKQPKCLSRDEWIKCVIYIYTMEYFFDLRKEGNPFVWYNMDEPLGHSSKWNKPVTKDKYCLITLTAGTWHRQIHGDKVKQRLPGAGRGSGLWTGSYYIMDSFILGRWKSSGNEWWWLHNGVDKQCHWTGHF